MTPTERGTPTHCPYCALQCAQTLTAPAAPTPGDAVLEVQGRDFPTNRGGLCRKGWTSAEVLTAPDRITRPQRRGADGRFQDVSWDDVLDLVAAHLRHARATTGPDAVAVFGGGGLTNEKAYALGKFTRVVLGSRYIDYNGRFCMAAAATASNRSLGMDRGLGFPLADLGGADAVLLLGSNVGATMPPFVQHLAGVRERGGLVVVDPRTSATAALTEDGAGTHLAPVPGTDLVVLLALLHVVLAEGLLDREYVEQRTTGLPELRTAASAWWPERAEAVCGIGAEALRGIARRLAAASPSRGGRGAYILTGRGVEQSTQGTATVTAAIDLALLLGLVGRPGSGVGPITGQGNGQGGREHGLKSDQLPGYRRIDDPAAREHVARVWGVDPADLPGPGVPAVQLLDSLGRPGGPGILLLAGANPVVSAPNSGAVRERLAALDLLVVLDTVPSETAQMADIVLPIAQWAEEEGTMTNLEGRVIRRRRARAAPGEARSELWILHQLAARLGHDTGFPTDAAEVFDELARASAGGLADYAGLSHERLDREGGVQWPCPSADHSGTERVFLDGFPTPDGRARLIGVQHHPPQDDVREDAPLHLTTGRLLEQYQSGAQTRRVPSLLAARPDSFVQMHPLLADRLGIEEGTEVHLRTRRGEARAPAVLTEAIRPDTVFMPFHYAGPGSANLLTNDATDPLSGMPEFKMTAVEVHRAPEQEEDLA
ncbi:molybdopterin oxidoreductase family protein [Brachybacterium sp. YJGR34]|uniref:molybdopterin oxidoreductase family protein n=1 Tax=Brachybacterium sp. YJGR34 TaxID=2059911 RepID=UPI000E0B42BE|nr:molybdopterin oxidoreductase family protein [Brachybacterium sp. YJGR34]